MENRIPNFVVMPTPPRGSMMAEGWFHLEVTFTAREGEDPVVTAFVDGVEITANEAGVVHVGVVDGQVRIHMPLWLNMGENDDIHTDEDGAAGDDGADTDTGDADDQGAADPP